MRPGLLTLRRRCGIEGAGVLVTIADDHLTVRLT